MIAGMVLRSIWIRMLYRVHQTCFAHVSLSHQKSSYFIGLFATDPEVLVAMRPWKEIIDAKGNTVVGISKVLLEKRRCSGRECNIGNFIADALVFNHIMEAQGTDDWIGTIVALVPCGDIRTSINKGSM